MKFKNLKLLNDVVMDYTNSFKMYELAKEYDKLKQGAAAFGWYLRAADFSPGQTDEEKLLQYKCIVRGSFVFNRSESRNQTTNGLIKSAINTLPDRPEAYYWAAQYHMEQNQWRDALMYAKMGLNCEDFKNELDLNYHGKVGLKYIYAMSKWKSDGRDDSKNLLFDLIHVEKNVPTHITEKVQEVLKSIGYPSTLAYKAKDINKYKFKFDGIEDIETNYSRHFQDMFVLSLLNGKRNGNFIEIGSGHPTLFNNTYLLESKFGWKGISLDWSERMCAIFSRTRQSNIVLANAATTDYSELFRQNCIENHVDYLRINADGGSLGALQNVPFHEHEFSIIQFQHNECWWGSELKNQSREILQNTGYKLLVPNVAINNTDAYEDWWVHPGFVKKNMKSDSKVNFAWSYMMENF